MKMAINIVISYINRLSKESIDSELLTQLSKLKLHLHNLSKKENQINKAS